VLSDGLSTVAGVTTPAVLPGRDHVWHQYTILLEDEARLTRDQLIDELTAAGIGCGIYYPKLVFDYACYRDHPQVIIESYPVASDVVQRCVSLPVHHHLTHSQLDRIVSTVSKLLGS
jgi:dTDP-4-amino-4,6-dideoxygalactose transaminase